MKIGLLTQRTTRRNRHGYCCSSGTTIACSFSEAASMRSFTLLFLLCVAGICGLVLFASASASDSGAAVDIERLIKQRGSDKYKEREAATKRLKEIGEPALK